MTASMAPSDGSLAFSDLPPFPTDVPTAPLLRLSLQKLLEGDAAELSHLWRTCCDVGFFYLDLRDAVGTVPFPHAHANGRTNSPVDGITGVTVDGNEFLSDAGKLFDFAEEFFALPLEEKAQYDFKEQGSYFGYKGYGAGVIDKEGTKDRNEFYNISKNDILSISNPIPAPELVTPYRALLASYITASHAIVTLLLTHLSTALGLGPNGLPSLHKLHDASGDQVRLVRAPPQPEQDRRAALGAHTDFGSVTLLFNRLGGLQILPPESDKCSAEQKTDLWQYVQPLRGHCVVNLGDAMVKFTRGVLRSNVHRVVNPPGLQGDRVRYSLVYFARPADEVLLKPLDGSEIVRTRKVQGVDGDEEEEVVSSREWVLRRALGNRGVGRKWEGTETARSARAVRA